MKESDKGERVASIIILHFRAIKRFNVALRVDPTYIRAFICRAEAYSAINEVIITCGVLVNVIEFIYFIVFSFT